MHVADVTVVISHMLQQFSALLTIIYYSQTHVRNFTGFKLVVNHMISWNICVTLLGTASISSRMVYLCISKTHWQSFKSQIVFFIGLFLFGSLTFWF